VEKSADRTAARETPTWVREARRESVIDKDATCLSHAMDAVASLGQLVNAHALSPIPARGALGSRRKGREAGSAL
jgi:hypothetical protein